MRGHSAACLATGQQHGFVLDYNNHELRFCSLLLAGFLLLSHSLLLS